MAYTTVNDSSAYFQIKTFTGDGNDNRAITNDGNSNLRPDWIWFKNRSTTNSHNLLDSRRGITKKLEGTNNTNAEGTTSTRLTSFDTDGFTVRTDPSVNGNTNKIIAWQWAAGGAAPTQTYRVVVVSDSGNKYRWRNSGNTATFAQSAVTLDLQEGGTYTIDGSDSTMGSHPIKLSTTSDGTHGGGSSYNTGVTYKLDGSTVTESAYVSGYSSATTRQLVITVAASAPTLYYYCHYHSGMGGQINTNSEFGSTNFDGSILSTVTANTTSGFSIVTYTGNGSAATIGHGLNGKPGWIIVKSRSNAVDWQVYVDKFGNDDEGLILNSNSAKFTSSNYWNNGATSSVFGVSSNTGVGANSYTYVAYCFEEVKGFSKFGSYAANGNADGQFTYTGFRPSFLMIKCTSHNGEWFMVDTTREPSNPAGTASFLQAQSSAAEYTSTDKDIDILSNGFKNRAVTGYHNDAGRTYSYYAFAENPLVGTNNIVGTAR